MNVSNRNIPRNATTLALTVSVLLAGCAAPAPSAQQREAAGYIKTDDLYVVDCLLPGQVRSLGQNFNYVAPRRPARLPAKDCALRGGEFVAYDRASLGTALKVWQPAAEAGDADAQNHLGEIYERGLGLPPDPAAAAAWYRKAAEQGHAAAQINLGSLHERGLGVPKDLTQAMNWYRKAAGVKEGSLEYTTADQLAQRRAQEAESQRLRSEVEQLRAQLANTGAELKRRNAQLDNDRRELDSLRKAQAGSADARSRLAALEARIREQESEIAGYENSTRKLLDQLGGGTQIATNASPQIQILTPQLSSTRSGMPAAVIAQAGDELKLIGRVQPAEAIASLSINGNDMTGRLDAVGLFDVEVPVPDGETTVNMEAVSRDGRRVQQRFVLAREIQRLLGSRDMPKLFQRRMREDLGSYHALVIGNDDYSEFGDLRTAVADAAAVADLLSSRYGYKVKRLNNASKQQLIATLSEYASSLGARDNLLIYYAGHGQIDAASGKGFWVPVDGRMQDSGSWVPNSVVTDFIGAMQAKHVMVVADSCYSGTLSGVAIRPIPDQVAENDLLFISRVKARTVLTSGGLAPVLDEAGGKHSIFAGAFIEALSANDGLLEGYRMYSRLAQQVAAQSRAARLEQRPEYTALKSAGHEGSEFFFLPSGV